ncbi:MAG: HlyU family transcriptional regulator [Pseudomonadota bacterium]
MSFLSKLFGGGGGSSSSEAEAETYKDFSIVPAPVREGSKWRIAARIEKEIGGTLKTHHLIRADMLDDANSAAEASVRKAKQVIDEQGARIFD